MSVKLLITNGRMRKHHGGNVFVIQFQSGFFVEDPVSQLSSGGDCHYKMEICKQTGFESRKL